METQIKNISPAYMGIMVGLGVQGLGVGVRVGIGVTVGFGVVVGTVVELVVEMV